MNLISAEKAAKNYGLHTPPLFEVILPMTTSASQLIFLQRSFGKIAHATEKIFDLKSQLRRIDVIPLFEEFDVISNCNKILKTYVDFYAKEFGSKPKYIRVFTARSDTAMNAGFLPAKLAVKMAINNYHKFSRETGVKVYPWVGGGCLPFRGGINPENIDAALEEYKGVYSLTVQSAFRYDYGLRQVRAAIAKMNEKLPENFNKYLSISDAEQKKLLAFNSYAAKLYKPMVESMAGIINAVAAGLPNHRERVQHVGLFGYSRGDGKVKLPRAIKFTGALYSLGVPPELIASGRALKHADDSGMLGLVKKLCPFLKEDFLHAGHYFNKENLELLAKRFSAFKEVGRDIELIEKILKIKIGPVKPQHFIHRNFTSNIYHKLALKESFADDALSAAKIRKSLG
jgi:phosphoenolpyruvate carboxylase